MKPHTMFVVPAAGLKIRYPDRPYNILPAEGADVPVSSFWLRRLKEGSIVRSKRAEVRDQRPAKTEPLNTWPEP